MAAVARWTADRTNGNVVGLGICFGGPFALTGAASGLFVAAAGAEHGYSHDGPAWDASAADSGMAAVRALLVAASSS